MKHDDILWKGIIEDMPAHFMRFFFPESEKLLDLNREFVFLDKELEELFPVENTQYPRFVDKLVKVFTKDGAEEWILIHIEVQGYHDKDFAVRMFTYFYRLLDRYKKPVTALAIFTDDNPNFLPKEYDYSFLGTSTTFKFNTYKVLNQPEDKLEQNTNPFSLVVLTVLTALKNKKRDDANLLNLKIELFKKMVSRQMDKKSMRALANFLKLYVHFASPETNAIFETNILSITNDKTTMGIEELILDRAKKEGIEKGKEIGIEEGKASVIQNLIINLGLTDEQVAKIAGVSESFVATVRKEWQKK